MLGLNLQMTSIQVGAVHLVAHPLLRQKNQFVNKAFHTLCEVPSGTHPVPLFLQGHLFIQYLKNLIVIYVFPSCIQYNCELNFFLGTALLWLSRGSFQDANIVLQQYSAPNRLHSSCADGNKYQGQLQEQCELFGIMPHPPATQTLDTVTASNSRLFVYVQINFWLGRSW